MIKRRLSTRLLSADEFNSLLNAHGNIRGSNKSNVARKPPSTFITSVKEKIKPGTQTASFSDFNLHPQVVESLARNNLVYPTAVQSGMFREWFLNQRNDLLVKAQTGTGKSVGYVALLFDAFLKNASADKNVPKNIIVVPNSVLADQLSRWFHYLLPDNLENAVSLCANGTDTYNPANTVIGTGRMLLSLVNTNKLSIDDLETVIIDEADVVIKPLKRYATERERANREKHPVPAQLLIQQLTVSNQNVRKVYLSATMNSLLKSHLKHTKLVRPGAVYVEAGEKVSHRLMGTTWMCPSSIEHRHVVLNANTEDHLLTLAETIISITQREGNMGLVVCDDTFPKEPLMKAITAYDHDGTINAELLFKSDLTNPNHDKKMVYIGSHADVRGLDLTGLEFVIICGQGVQRESDMADYVHAVGRVGRMGRAGRAYTVLTGGASPLGETELIRHLGHLSSRLRVTSVPANL